MVDVFPTSVSTAIFEVLFISHKHLIVPGLYSRSNISIAQSFSHNLSKYLLASAKNKYVLYFGFRFYFIL